MDDKENVMREFEQFGQGHIFQFWNFLSPDEKQDLIDQLKEIDLIRTEQMYSNALKYATGTTSPNMKPFPDVCPYHGTEEQRKEWETLGYQQISEGKVAVLLLAGGQGTRLGVTIPKGMYDIGLPSGKSLFHLQAERLLKVQNLVKRHCNKDVAIPWYIMTSDATNIATKKYFSDRNYFGLQASQFLFFEQHMVPCLTPEGKIIMESKNKVARSPNGNGGLYEALQSSGALADMKKRGIEFVSQYCVDNSLVKILDPTFVGYCSFKKIDCAAKVVAKASPEEPVGVVCLRDGKPAVMEYSEIPKDIARMTDNEGKLIYNASHVCMNMFSVEFLDKIANKHNLSLPYHIAKKKIPAVNSKGETETPPDINGWKLELFIFDSFEFALRMAAFEVLREEEFSPLKNGPSSPKDNPITCRTDVSELHKNFLRRNGGIIEGDRTALFEISPLISCYGEDLEERVKGKTFKLPLELNN